MNDTPEKADAGSNARRQVMAAARAEIRRREVMLRELEQLDETVFAAAWATFQSPPGAAEWLIGPAFALGGEIPTKVAATPDGKRKVLSILASIEYNTRI